MLELGAASTGRGLKSYRRERSRGASDIALEVGPGTDKANRHSVDLPELPDVARFTTLSSTHGDAWTPNHDCSCYRTAVLDNEDKKIILLDDEDWENTLVDDEDRENTLVDDEDEGTSLVPEMPLPHNSRIQSGGSALYELLSRPELPIAIFEYKLQWCIYSEMVFAALLKLNIAILNSGPVTRTCLRRHLANTQHNQSKLES